MSMPDVWRDAHSYPRRIATLRQSLMQTRCVEFLQCADELVQSCWLRRYEARVAMTSAKRSEDCVPNARDRFVQLRPMRRA